MKLYYRNKIKNKLGVRIFHFCNQMEESTHSKSEISSNESEEMNEEVPVEITVRGLLIVLVLG